MNFLLVGLGGFFGAISRYFVYLIIPAHSFPLATLLVNIVGSFFLGIIFSLSTRLSTEIVTTLTIGFLGAFTTFSTFSADTITLLKSGNVFYAALNIILNVTLSIFAFYFASKIFS